MPVEETEVRTSFEELAKLQLEIYAKEVRELYREVRDLRSRVADYESKEIAGSQSGPAPGTADLESSRDGTFEGDVRLSVEVEGSIGLVVSFVQQLREMPAMRLRRLSNDKGDGVTLWVALREPTSLLDVLGSMEGVSEVAPDRTAAPASEVEQIEDDERVLEIDGTRLTVRLVSNNSAAAASQIGELAAAS